MQIEAKVQELMASKDLYNVVVKPVIDQAFVFGVNLQKDLSNNNSPFQNNPFLAIITFPSCDEWGLTTYPTLVKKSSKQNF